MEVNYFQKKRHRCIEQYFGLCGRGRGWDDLGGWHWNMYSIIYEMNRQSRFDAWYWMLGAGALEKFFKEARGGKSPTYRATRIRITSDFSSQTKQARRDWSEIFIVLKENTNINLQFCILKWNYPSKVKKNTFSDKNWGNLSTVSLLNVKRNSAERKTN